jgi:5-methylcytosine-specific restriction endonuclease McrA
MVAKPTAKKKKWFVDRCEEGCQICGTKFPHLKNNGLQFSHIISPKDGGSDEEINCLALCPNCSTAFDVILKPAIYKALDKLSTRRIPESWEKGEGRKSIVEQLEERA